MKVLVIGGGGREHAIVDSLSRSPQVDKLYCAPGNAGIAQQAECVNIKDTDVNALRDFALNHSIDLTVVGPEAALAAGVVDAFREAGLKIFGHTKAATQIESSKEFAKQIMEKYGVPTAAYKSFSDFNEALAYVKAGTLPAVLKYDGLAAGKGVVIAETLEQAEETLRSMLLDEEFGSARVVIEDYLTGPEFSFMCFVNGDKIIPMPLAQDHKRAYDGDKGPNTGGMGAYTHLPFITPEDIKFAEENVLQRTADGMVKEGKPLTGVLYGGLMKTPQGIKVIEFNARFGDPETEVVLPLLESDIADIFLWGAGVKNEVPAAKWSNATTMGVVLASKGYPGSYEKNHLMDLTELSDAKICTPTGAPIVINDKAIAVREAYSSPVQIFHMGTAVKEGQLLTNGGRVIMVTVTADNLHSAQQEVYKAVKMIKCDNLFYRNDIAHQGL